MSERHFNRMLNQEPEETLDEFCFTMVADLIQQAELQAGAGESVIATSTIQPEYAVQRYDGPDGLITLGISWIEGDTFVTMNMRNDHGLDRNQFAGTFAKLDRIGGLVEERTLSDQDLVNQWALILDSLEYEPFTQKKLIPHILLAA